MSYKRLEFTSEMIKEMQEQNPQLGSQQVQSRSYFGITHAIVIKKAVNKRHASLELSKIPL